MNAINIKLYDIFRNDLHLAEPKARELVETIEDAVRADIRQSKEEYKSLWKEDFRMLDTKIDRVESKLELKIAETKGELTRAIYWVGLIQFLAIVGSVVGILGFMLRK